MYKIVWAVKKWSIRHFLSFFFGKNWTKLPEQIMCERVKLVGVEEEIFFKV